MSEVISLHLSHVLRQAGVMQRIVHAVVENVEGESAGNYTVRNCLGENEMSEISEWRFEHEEEGGRHDQTKSIHGQVVMDTV